LNIISENEKQGIINKFGRLDIHEEENSSRFITRILDRFNKQLNQYEAFELIDFTNHNLKFEGKYIDFITKAFALNNNIVYISLEGTMTTSTRELKKKFFSKSDIDFYIKSIFPLRSNVIKLDDPKILELFIKLTTREVCLFNFFFDNCVVVGNFDLSFPIYCLDNEIYYEYENIANQIGLYLRV
jgi:hypothetical protein